MSAFGDPVISLRDLRVSLPSEAGLVNILHGIDLALPEGASLAVTGPSGSGKTTLMMVIAGLELPTSGTVRVAGRDLAAMNESALAVFRRDHIGIVFQAFHLIPTMTAVENVAVPLELAGRRDAFAVAAQALDAVGLSARLRHYPGQLSGGEQQRVALARAFAARPRLLLADEPTGNLDARTGGVVADLLFDLRRSFGTTLVLITHEPALAERCERVLRLEDGRVAGDHRSPVNAAAQ